MRVPTKGKKQRPVKKKMMFVTLVKYDSKNVMNIDELWEILFCLFLDVIKKAISMVSKGEKNLIVPYFDDSSWP